MKCLPLCRSPSKFGGEEGFRSVFGLAIVTAASGRVVLYEHVSPSSPFPVDHLGALERQIAAVAGHSSDVTGLLAAVVGGIGGRDPYA